MTGRSPYRLDSVQLEEIVQALQKAAETLRPKPSEEHLYRLLGICVRAAGTAFTGIMLVVLVTVMLEEAGAKESTAVGIMEIVFTVFSLFFIFAAFGALILLLLNQSVVRKEFRKRRLLKKLGISEVSLSAWRLQRRGRRWSRLAGAVLSFGGMVSLVFGVAAGISWIGSMGRFEWSVAFNSGLLFAFGVTVSVWRFVQRSREQWAIVADANRLRSVLESMRTKADAGEVVAIPAAVVEHAAQIERVSIARQRRDAVAASAGTTDHGYGVLVAGDLSSQKRLLDPQQRVAVEDLIENLGANPRPAGVESTPDGLLSVKTPAGDVELNYTVDEGAQRVNIVALTAHDHG